MPTGTASCGTVTTSRWSAILETSRCGYALYASAPFARRAILLNARRFPARFQPFFKLNPMFYLLEGFRGLIYYGAVPSWHLVAASLLLGGIALVIGLVIFARYQDSFVFYV